MFNFSDLIDWKHLDEVRQKNVKSRKVNLTYQSVLDGKTKIKNEPKKNKDLEHLNAIRFPGMRF
jgi:hypothetical protein